MSEQPFYGRNYDEPFDPGPDGNPALTDDELAAQRARQLFPRLDWHELWADDTEEEWIHEPLIPARRSVSIYSAPKVGKSLLMLELAVTVSRGETFLGHHPDRRYHVLYVDFENDPRGDVRTRLQAMGYVPDDLDHLDYLSFPQMAGFDTERGSLELLEAVKAYRSEVVIIDTVSRAVDGEENSNDTWLGLYRRTLLKLKRAGVAVVRLDHSGKDETKGQRGGSAKSGDVDAVWRLSKITDQRFRLECTDARLVINTKALHVIRRTIPRLHHLAEVLGAMDAREAKIIHLIELCDANSLPLDTGRDGIRLFAKARGIKARNDVYSEVAKRRKGTPEPVPAGRGQVAPTLPVPDSGDSAGRDTPETTLTSTNTCPQPDGDSRGQVPPTTPVPVPPSIEGDRWGTGPLEANSPPCTTCGQPIGNLREAYGKTSCADCERGAS